MQVPPNVKNKKLVDWVQECVELCKPDHVVWCDGSQEEYDRLCQLLVDGGTFTRLNPDKKPNSFHAASDPSDVARVEDRTFICSEREDDAGPTNNWVAPAEMRANLEEAGNAGAKFGEVVVKASQELSQTTKKAADSAKEAKDAVAADAGEMAKAGDMGALMAEAGSGERPLFT